MKILTVPGIRSQGEGNTDLLGAELRRRGFEVVDVNQAVRHTWDVRDKSKVLIDAMDIVKLAKDGDWIIAHSYAGLKTAIAMEHCNFARVYMFRPAMSRKYKFPAGELNLTCIHSWADGAIWVGGVALIKHKFGLAGVFGFKDLRSTNIRSRGRHNADFKPKAIQHWVDHIEKDYLREKT